MVIPFQSSPCEERAHEAERCVLCYSCALHIPSQSWGQSDKQGDGLEPPGPECLGDPTIDTQTLAKCAALFREMWDPGLRNV